MNKVLANEQVPIPVIYQYSVRHYGYHTSILGHPQIEMILIGFKCSFSPKTVSEFQ